MRAQVCPPRTNTIPGLIGATAAGCFECILAALGSAAGCRAAALSSRVWRSSRAQQAAAAQQVSIAPPRSEADRWDVRLPRWSDRDPKMRLGQSALAVALILIVKLIDWRNRYQPT